MVVTSENRSWSTRQIIHKMWILFLCIRIWIRTLWFQSLIIWIQFHPNMVFKFIWIWILNMNTLSLAQVLLRIIGYRWDDCRTSNYSMRWNWFESLYHLSPWTASPTRDTPVLVNGLTWSARFRLLIRVSLLAPCYGLWQRPVLPRAGREQSFPS